jgi:transposase
MPAPYSPDLRLRVMDAVRSGMSYAEVTRRFRVSNSTILRWVRRLRESGSYAALPMGGRKPFVLADERDWLLQRFAAKPDVTLREVLAELHDRGIEVGYFALWHIVRRAGLRFKKRLPMRVSRIAATSRAAAVGGGGGYNG